MNKKKVTIILPSYNEEESIGQVLDEVNRLPIDKEVIVVNNNSTDRTALIAFPKCDRLLEEKQKGKGIAMRTAFKLVDTPYVFMVNSDLTYPISEIPTMLLVLESGIHSAIAGWRKTKTKDSMALVNKFGNICLTFLANLLYPGKPPIKDLCTGLWGFDSEVLKEFHLTSKGFTLEADLFINLRRLSKKLANYPINYQKRGGKAKLKVLDGFRIAWFLTKRRMVWPKA